jgi:hypothetical protein
MENEDEDEDDERGFKMLCNKIKKVCCRRE